jgi:large subunit ribosomal protein L24
MKTSTKQAKRGTVRLKIKKGDTVVFISGKDYNRFDGNGKRTPHRGKVIQVDPRKGKVKVEGAGIVKKHQKAVPQLNKQGGIVEQESWIDVSNVALLDPENGKPTRVRYQTNDDGKKARVAVGSGKEI